MMQRSWSRTVLITLLAAALPAHGWAYKILLIPWIGKSHVFSMATIAEGLANRGHQVTLVVGENYKLNLPELRNRTEISITRFKDPAMDYDGVAEQCSQTAMDAASNLKQLSSIASIMSGVYVSFFTARRVCCCC